MNRKRKRELRKEVNLLKELYAIIMKYFPQLFHQFDHLTDSRNQSYVTYSMKTICVTRLLGLLCGLPALGSITKQFNTEIALQNISSICKQELLELPYWQTIQDVFEQLKIEEIRKIQKDMILTLIRSKMLDKYRYEGRFQLVFDGTGLSHHNYNLNGNCLERHRKDGTVSYYKYVLECKLVVGNMVFSLDSEFIENDKMLTEKQKQDCEIKAFKRMAVRIKKNFPKLNFIITGDALYATTPIINICKNFHWSYLFNFKPDRLKTIGEEFMDNIQDNNETKVKHFFLSRNLSFKENKVNVFQFLETKGKKETVFRYLTNLDIQDYNIKEICLLGRKRWKIENEAFYTQKHRTFNISHLCSRNDTAMKIHYFFIQFAHTIRQLLEFGRPIRKVLGYQLKEISVALLSTLTSTISDLNHYETNFQLRFDT